jgi:hypothetical protein
MRVKHAIHVRIIGQSSVVTLNPTECEPMLIKIMTMAHHAETNPLDPTDEPHASEQQQDTLVVREGVTALGDGAEIEVEVVGEKEW